MRFGATMIRPYAPPSEQQFEEIIELPAAVRVNERVIVHDEWYRVDNVVWYLVNERPFDDVGPIDGALMLGLIDVRL